MNVMFLSIENYLDFNTRSIYMDLINEFRKKGHYVTVISACEKRDIKDDKPVIVARDDHGEIRKIYVSNVTKMSNFILKGINLMKLLSKYKTAVKCAMREREYSLVLYGSPPITVYSAVIFLKKKQNVYSYLLLKDIWPYDCLFGGALSLNGPKKLAFNYLALLARRLYNTSDMIGCMSPANIKFLLENEPYLKNKNKIEICPNSILPQEIYLDNYEKLDIRRKYGIPEDKVVFIYGGSLGVPQGIDFALSAVSASTLINEAYFVFVGGGTEKDKINNYIVDNNLKNAKLLEPLKKHEYEKLVSASDVGLVFLHHDCLAPNYPSRILTYMQSGIPLLCATDTYTDVGCIAEQNGYGLWCESNCENQFVENVRDLCNKNVRLELGKRAKEYLYENYTVEKTYEIIMKRVCVNE